MIVVIVPVHAVLPVVFHVQACAQIAPRHQVALHALIHVLGNAYLAVYRHVWMIVKRIVQRCVPIHVKLKHHSLAQVVLMAALGIVLRLAQMHAKLRHHSLAQVVLMAALGIVLRPVPMLVKHKHDNRQAEILVMDVAVLV